MMVELTFSLNRIHKPSETHLEVLHKHQEHPKISAVVISPCSFHARVACRSLGIVLSFCAVRRLFCATPWTKRGGCDAAPRCVRRAKYATVTQEGQDGWRTAAVEAWGFYHTPSNEGYITRGKTSIILVPLLYRYEIRLNPVQPQNN